MSNYILYHYSAMDRDSMNIDYKNISSKNKDIFRLLNFHKIRLPSKLSS